MSLASYILSFVSGFSTGGGQLYKSYHDREEYYRSLLREDNEERLFKLLSEHQEAVTNPAVEIMFRGVKFGSSQKQVCKRLGKPRFEISNDALISHHKIFFYRFNIYHMRAIAQLHFMKGEFFYAKYTFKDSDSNSFSSILGVLKNKYFTTKHFQENISRVRDEQGNMISLEKSLHLNIKYISGDPTYRTYLQQVGLRKQELNEKRKSRRLKSLQDSL